MSETKVIKIKPVQVNCGQPCNFDLYTSEYSELEDDFGYVVTDLGSPGNPPPNDRPYPFYFHVKYHANDEIQFVEIDETSDPSVLKIICETVNNRMPDPSQELGEIACLKTPEINGHYITRNIELIVYRDRSSSREKRKAIARPSDGSGLNFDA